MSRLLTAIPIALVLTACVGDNADSGLYILRNLAPDTSCVLDPSSSEFRSSGVIQSDSSRGYFLTPVARNDLVVPSGQSESQSLIFVDGARITISFTDDELFSTAELATLRTDGVTQFETRTSGSIDPGGGIASFGFVVVGTDLLTMVGARLPAPSLDNPVPSALLDVGVQLFGTRAGSSIESNVFHYPVEVCNDCLLRNVGLCDALPSDFAAATGGACNLLQDGALDCCTTATGGLMCPAASTTPET